MLDVKRLRVLHEVARQGSFSAAADALSYTQSAISQQIAALERETGTTLVDRGARGIRLTDAGEALVRHADAILTRISDAEAELEAIAGLRGGRVRLASFATAGSTFVPHAIATFHEQHPDVEILLRESDPEESVPALKAGQLDIAILFEPHGAGDLTDLEQVHLLEDPMSVVLPEDHPLASKAKVRLKDLSRARRGCRPRRAARAALIVADQCRAAGFEPRVAFESDDYLTVQGLVAAGVGVAMIPSLGLAAYRPDVAIRPIVGAKPKRDIYAVTLPVRAPLAGHAGDDRRALRRREALRPRRDASRRGVLGGVRDPEQRLHAGGEHQVAVDLQLAGHEHRRAGGVAADELQEVHRLQLERDARRVVAVLLDGARAVLDHDLVAVVAAAGLVEDLPLEHGLGVARLLPVEVLGPLAEDAVRAPSRGPARPPSPRRAARRASP